MSEPLVSTGTTFNFSGLGFSAKVVDLTPPNESLEPLNVSHMGSTGHHKYIPAKLVEGGDLTLNIQWDPSQTPPWGEIDEIIVTYPDGTAESFLGFMTAQGPTAQLETVMMANVTFKVADDITYTPGGGASAS